MKIKNFLILFSIIASGNLLAQENQEIPKFYLGAAYGKSFALGDFKDTDLSNENAGFAKDGNRLDIYGGYFLDKKENFTATGVFRYQTFDTEVEDLLQEVRNNNPGLDITGSTEEWHIYSLLFGLAYKIDIAPKFAVLPRVAIGPIWAKSPGISINSSNDQFITRDSNTGVGFGYEVGLGFQRNLGKHFRLLPTFTLSGGRVNIKDVVTTTGNVQTTNDYKPDQLSFNIGLSLAYVFY